MQVPEINGHQPDELILESQKAAQFIIDSVVDLTGAKKLGLYKRKDLKGFNWSEAPIVLIEMGFMTDDAEDENLNDSDYQQLLATGMLNGCIAYFSEKLAQ